MQLPVGKVKGRRKAAGASGAVTRSQVEDEVRGGNLLVAERAPVGAAASLAGSARKGKAARQAAVRRVYVLDTNVLLHDPSCLFRFAEHDLFVPMMVLEELDATKKGSSDLARAARQVTRELDRLLSTAPGDSAHGVPLSAPAANTAVALGSLFLQTEDLYATAGGSERVPDNKILGATQALVRKQAGREVILVTNDINMRVKAKALGLRAEAYLSDKTLDDGDVLFSGFRELPGNAQGEWDGDTWVLRGAAAKGLSPNEFVFQRGDARCGRVVQCESSRAEVRRIRDYCAPQHAVWGIHARNKEQAFALDLLTDPDCDFVSLAGTAGTGKTLLALAAGLQQLANGRYTEIIVTRATVPVGDDIGFLPGTEEEKMSPWMGALHDNLEALNGAKGTSESVRKLQSKIKVKSLNFMRGRTFMNKFILVDEAQNLTPKQMKTMVTRAGVGTKLVCTGNLAQIDTPYLTEGGSGFTYVIDRFKAWAHAGHVTMQRGERSRLADYANQAL